MAVAAIEETVTANMALAMYVVNQVVPEDSPYREDAFQAACEGLVKAAKRFDSSRGTKFSTFAYREIRGEVLRFVRYNALPGFHVPRRVREAIVTLNKVRQEVGDSPDALVQKLVEHGHPLSAARLAVDYARTIILSLDDNPTRYGRHSDSQEVSAYEVVPDPAADVEEAAIDRLFAVRVFGYLPRLEREVLFRHVVLEESLQEIAKVLRLDVADVADLLASGKKRVRTALQRERLPRR